MDPQLNHVYALTNENRERFEAFSRSLSADELALDVPQATWTVKDYIAHLATIDIWVGDWFEHQADGKPWRPRGEEGAAFNIDTWNEAEVVARRSASVEDLLAEGARHRERLWAAVDRFTPEVLEAKFDFHHHSITFLRYLELWASHDPAHAADMCRALPSATEDAGVRAWLAPFAPK